MAKAKKTGNDTGVLELLRGGKQIPESLVRQHLARIRAKEKARLEKATDTRQQMAKYLSAIQPPSKIDSSDPQAAKGLDGMLKMHQKLAAQKIAPPKIAGLPGGIVPGRISVQAVPPYDFDVVIPTVLAGPAPTLSESSDKNTAQMSASAITSSDRGFGGGSMFTTMGIYFHPVSSGTLTVRATPKFSFQRWTNALASASLVRSFGSGAITIQGIDVASQTIGNTGTILSAASQQFFHWDETQTGQITFDFGFDLQAPVSTHLAVNHTLVYLIFVEADVHVEGVGWPGSLAGAVMSVAVPSISYDFDLDPVFSQ